MVPTSPPQPSPDDDPAIDLVLDTNVFIEFICFYDLMIAAENELTPEKTLLSRPFAYRSRRSRDTAMFGWQCHIDCTRTLIMETEALRPLLRAVPPEPATQNSELLKTILYFVRDHVLHGWKHRNSSDDNDSIRGTAADDWLLEKAVGLGVPLITNEGNLIDGISESSKGKPNLRGKAKARNVPVFTPFEYLQVRRFDFEKSAEAFIESFERNRPLFLAGRDDALLANEALDALLGLYRLVLLDDIADELRGLPRVSWP